MKRVVVTGLGAVTSVGLSAKDTFSSLVAGISGVSEISKFDTTDFKTKIAAEIKKFDPSDWDIPPKDAKRMDLFSLYSMAAAKEAIDDSGLNTSDITGEKSGISIGTGFGGITTVENEKEKILKNGASRTSPFFVPMMIPNIAAGNISIKYGIKGVQYSPNAACASGSMAIVHAFDAIRNGYADIMIAGGAEAPITPLCISGFSNMKALSTKNETPTQASAPFDKNRDGFVAGEGAGILILESLEHAEKRGARVYGEICGYGISSDSYHITQPDPEGEGALRSMSMAFKMAEVPVAKLGYINAHGSATEINDRVESLAIKKLLGGHTANVLVNSSKSMMGHLLGAAGAVEALITLSTIYKGTVHPTLNLVEPGFGCTLNYVKDKFIEKDICYGLSNSFGFGGVNISLLFSRCLCIKKS